MSIEEKIKEFRIKGKVSQLELSKRLGIDRATLSLIENGKRKFNVNELVRVSEMLGLTIDQAIKKEEAEQKVEHSGGFLKVENGDWVNLSHVYAMELRERIGGWFVILACTVDQTYEVHRFNSMEEASLTLKGLIHSIGYSR